ncbi:MAG: phosphopantetheine-binding protein [Caulobacterales bacterium]
MADGSASSAGAQVSAIVRSLLTKRSLGAPTGPKDDLRKLGLTSLDMVNLMLAVEDEFGIEFPQAAMTPENFRSIAAIEKLVNTVASAA